MASLKRAEYLKFLEVQSTHLKTRLIDVRTVNSDVSLGLIKWYPRWRQYVFAPASNTVFNPSCLHEIMSRVDAMTVQHKEALRMKRRVNG